MNSVMIEQRRNQNSQLEKYVSDVSSSIFLYLSYVFYEMNEVFSLFSKSKNLQHSINGSFFKILSVLFAKRYEKLLKFEDMKFCFRAEQRQILKCCLIYTTKLALKMEIFCFFFLIPIQLSLLFTVSLRWKYIEVSR